MRTQSILRRLGALALAMVMTLSLVTMPALAEENPDTGDTLVEASAPVTTGGETPVETTQATEAPVETTQATEAPVETTQATEAPVETTQATEAPVETTQATEAPTETTQATEAPTENPEPTETTEAPTEAPTETTEATEAPTETTEVTEPTETTEVTEPTETTEDPAAAESAKRVAEVQAMIDALRTEFPEEEWEAEKAKYDAVTAALAALTEEEKGKLNLERYLALGELIQSLTVPLDEKGLEPIIDQDTLQKVLNDPNQVGGVIVLESDITLSTPLLIGATADDTSSIIPNYPDVTIDLNGHSIISPQKTGDAQKTFRIYSTAKTTIKNGKIVNEKIGARCVDTRVNADVNLINLDMYTSSKVGSGSGDNNQPITIGGTNVTGTRLTMDGCSVNAETAGYAIINFVKDAVVTVQNSSLKGYAVLYAQSNNSDGSVFNLTNTNMESINVHAAGSNSSFAAFAIDAPVTINISDSKIHNSADKGCNQYVFSIWSEVKGTNINVVNTPITQDGINAYLTDLGNATYDRIVANTIKLPAGCADQLAKEQLKLVDGKVMPMINSEERLIAAVNAGDKVVLDDNITLSEPLVIPQGKSVTLNLNGFTLENSKDFQEDSLVIVDSGASLTVTGNGTIRSAGNGIKMTRTTNHDPNKTASLVVESGTVEAKSAAIIGNGNRHGTSITINGGTLKGDGGAIYHPQQGKVVINGGSLTGGEFGVEMRAGELTVNGGTITATADKFEIQGNDSGSTTQGVAVAVVPYSADIPVNVTINNGKLEGQHALHQEILKDNTGDVTLAVIGGTFAGEVVAKDEEKFISGGSFSKAPAENLAVENWSVTENPDGSFGVQEDPFIVDQDGNKEHVDPSKPLVLDELLEKNKEKDTVSLTISADAQVNKDHVLSGTLLLQADGHRIIGSGSIRTGKKLELKDFGSLKTRVTLPEGGKLVFKDGRVQVLPSERTNDDHEGVGYSVPVIITVGDSTYTYFLSMDPDNAGKIVLDETGKPLVLGQYYSSKGDDAKAPEFTFVYISSHGTYYLGRHTDMTFVSNAPIPSMDYITIDGDPVEGKYLTEPDDEDTASVTLSYRFLRNLDTGKHTIRMYFKDGSRAKAEFSVRKTSVYDPENPKTGDTIFLPLAVMTLSAAALAVLMPRKKKYL